MGTGATDEGIGVKRRSDGSLFFGPLRDNESRTRVTPHATHIIFARILHQCGKLSAYQRHTKSTSLRVPI